MRKLIVIAVLLILSLAGTATAANTKPNANKTAMCYQYTPGGWTTVYVPTQQVDNRLAKGDYLYGECLPA